MTGQKKSWGDYYEGAGGVDYFLDHIAIHKDFLKEILRRKPRTVMEAGCGSAIMSVFFAMTGLRATACDRDEAVLRKAADIAGQWKSPVTFVKEDILKTSFRDDAFDVVFSQGVLEHLDDGQIRLAAAESLRVGKAFIFSVPGQDYRHRDFGDERLLSASDWKRILRGAGKLEIAPYYFIRTKRNFLIKRPLMLMGILCR
jgi:SAM-dependent methyltransferase